MATMERAESWPVLESTGRNETNMKKLSQDSRMTQFEQHYVLERTHGSFGIPEMNFWYKVSLIFTCKYEVYKSKVLSIAVLCYNYLFLLTPGAT
jgi:hypothetical protein